MSKVFAKVGESFQSIGDTECPQGFIEMECQRPGPYDTAQPDGTWLPGTAPAPRWSAREFIGFFAPDEWKAIRALSRTNDDVGVWYDKVLAADFVTMDDPETVGGLAYALEVDGITSERHDAIALQARAQPLG